MFSQLPEVVPIEPVTPRAALSCGFEPRELVRVSKFGEWVAEYVFRQQMTLFGEQFEQSARETAEKTDTSKGRVRNLLKDLPQKFTNADLIGLRRKNGQSTRIDVVLSRWLKAGYIKKDGEKMWVKVVNS